MLCIEPVVQKYLDRYANTSPPWGEFAAAGPFDQAVVVPSCGEDEILGGLFESIQAAANHSRTKCLILLVVNDHPGTAENHRQANQALLRRMPVLARRGACVIATLNFAGRCKGVGQARKIGCDAALFLWAKAVLKSQWIHTTDADARVALDYFEDRTTLSPRWGLGPQTAGALIHPFEHMGGGEMGWALEQYDRFLRYYSRGLAFAGSPYAYPTIGSTISFSPLAYAKVRGFPTTEAGEDFHFLHKVAKLAFVGIGGGKVSLMPRTSDRVPFGTGRAIARIETLRQAGQPYLIYDPRVFEGLKEWLQQIPALASSVPWCQAVALLCGPVQQALEAVGAPSEAARIAATRPKEADRLRHWHTWFDGLRTLRFIHFLRDKAYPNTTLEAATALLARMHPVGGWEGIL